MKKYSVIILIAMILTSLISAKNRKNRDVGEKFQILYTASKLLSEPVAWLKTI